VKLHPNTLRFDVADPPIAKIVARAGQLGVPITFDASALLDADQIGKFIKLAIMNPQTDIILAHMGGTRFDELTMLKPLAMYPWWKRNLGRYLFHPSPFRRFAA
jgi:predicted TIM-barrel fold metal-dependent hydrolase